MIVTYKKRNRGFSGRPEKHGRGRRRYFLVKAHSKDTDFYDALYDNNTPILFHQEEVREKLNRLPVGSYFAFHVVKENTWYYEMKTSCLDCKCIETKVRYVRRKFGAPYWKKFTKSTKCQLKNALKNMHTLNTL